MPHPNQFKEFRESIREEWFTHWRDGKLYGIPRFDDPRTIIGDEEHLACTDHDHLHVLAARINDCLPACFPQYEAFRRKPFAFLGRKDELVSKMTQEWVGFDSLVKEFQIRPKFELDLRIIELPNGETEVALILALNTRWDIFAPVDKLQQAGIELHGLHVVRRSRAYGERLLVGRIGTVDGEDVRL